MPAELQPSPPVKASYRRLAIGLGLGVAAAVLLFLLVVFVLPTPLARYVIESQLENLGIQHDGIKTVEIDLWNNHVRAGPVSFRSGQAQEGQIGETGFDYSLGAFFEGRAFVQTFYLRGVDLYVARLKDGSIEINGVNLRDIAGPQEEAASQEQSPGKDEDSGFQVGVERFEFTDSQLVFEDVSGGKLTIELERLTLDRLLSWTPQEPTTFTLEGRLNEIEISFDGTVTPLGDPLLFTFNSRVSGITIDRVARFVGPTGLERQDGSLSTEVHYAYAIHSDGRIEGTVDGTYGFNDLEIATAEGETATLDKAILRIDLKQALLPDGSASATGQLRLDASSLSIASAAGDGLEVGQLDLTVSDLDLKKGVERRRRLWEAESSQSGTNEPSKRIPSIVELMIGWARDLGQEALSHHLSINGRPTLTLANGLIRIAARGDTPGQEIRFEKSSVNLGEVVSQAFDSGFSAAGILESAASGLRLTVDGGRAEAELSDLQVDSNAITLRATTEETTLAFDLKVLLEKLAASDDTGGALDLKTLSLVLPGFTIKETADSQEATGPLALSLEDLAADLPGAEGVMTLRGDRLDLNLTPFSLAGKETEAGSFDGSLEARGLSLERAGESPLSAALTSTRTALQGIRIAPLGAQAEIEGGLVTNLSGISLEAGQGTEVLSLSLDTLDNQVERLRASGFDGGEASISLSNHTKLSGLAARLPLGGGRSLEAAIASLEAPLSELALSGEALRAEGALTVTGIAAATEGEAPQSLEIASLTVTGLKGDSETGVELESVALGSLIAKVTLPLPGWPEEGASGEPAAAQRASDSRETSPQFDKRIKLGEFSLAPGSRVEITDSGLKPPLKVGVLLEDLKFGPLDTAAVNTRTKLALAASIDKATKTSLEGWASPFKPLLDFEVTSRVDALSLPPLSPYAAAALGVDLESGALSAQVDANSTEGKLQGKIDLRIDDLFVVPVSDEDAEKLQSSIGLPVGFAVSILKNSEGVIKFGLPLSGTPDSPKIDYSEAISKAISGAMASVFPTSWFGPDGNTFTMQPAPFVPGTTELTEEGTAVADQIAQLFADKPGMSIRACGRAARDDLIALRGGPAEAPPASAAPVASEAPAPAEAAPVASEAPAPAEPASDGSGPKPAPPPPPVEEIAAPSDQEVEALLALATQRGAAIHRYLETIHGIDPARVPECRTAYSIKDGKPPRAEFQF